MRTTPKIKGMRRRLTALLLAAGATGALAGCSDLLSVDNPGAINPESLENSRYIPLMINGVIGEFQNFHGYTAMYSSVFTDEFRNHHVYFENRDMDLRRVGLENGTYVLYVWNTMHRSRFMADNVSSRLKALLGDSAKSDLGLARVLAYGGLTYTYMGEQFCETPIDMGPGNSPEQMFTLALPKFDEAIAVATAARAKAAGITPATPASSRIVAGADSVLAFARVGAARAALNLGDRTKAAAYARAVTPAYTSEGNRGFVIWSHFLESTLDNPMWQAIATASGGGNRWLSVRNTPFDSVQDPRVPLEQKTVMDAMDGAIGGPLVPNSPSSYNTWSGTAGGADLTKSAWIRIASALEARYIQAEAEGLTAENLGFVNERRAVGNKDPLPATASEAEYMAALRRERSIDLFADGHRLGDLRRYDKLYPNRADNVWQTGPYPGSTSGETYGEQKCWPVPLSELQGNPNYR
jgi:hypothetical protein